MFKLAEFNNDVSPSINDEFSLLGYRLSRPCEFFITRGHNAGMISRLRRSGEMLPNGKTSAEGIWLPSHREHCACCDSVRPPTIDDRNTYLYHCCTEEHIGQLVGLSAEEVLDADYNWLEGCDTEVLRIFKLAAENFLRVRDESTINVVFL